MVGGEEGGAAKARRHRQVEALGKTHESIMRLLRPARTAENDERPLGRGEKRLELRHLGFARRGLCRLDAWRVRDRRHLGQHVLGKRDHDGPGPPLRRDPEGARHDLRDARGRIDLDGPFGHGAEHGLVVELLEGLALAHAALHLADEDDQRGGILHGDVNARRRVRGARSARDEADAGPAGEPCVGVGHHRGAALLAADEHVDRGVVQRVENREIALAGHAGRAVDALDEELIDEDLAAAARELHLPR